MKKYETKLLENKHRNMCKYIAKYIKRRKRLSDLNSFRLITYDFNMNTMNCHLYIEKLLGSIIVGTLYLVHRSEFTNLI